MGPSLLQSVVQAVIRRARRQGSVLPREVREELARANLPDRLWKDMVQLAGPALAYRGGRYHYVPAGAPRMRARLRREQRNHLEIHKAVCGLLGQKRRSALTGRDERRAHQRIDFVRPVRLQTADGRTLHLLSRNISLSGIRLVGATPLQGKTVSLWFGGEGDRPSWGFSVRMLWSSPVGDRLIESGGIFLEKLKDA